MKLKIGGYKVDYVKTYWCDSRDIEVKLPQYILGDDVRIKVNNKWVKCRFNYQNRKDKTNVDISANAYKYDKNNSKGTSELGEVNQQGYFTTLKINKFNRLMIKIYNILYGCKIQILKTIDWIKSIKVNFILISISGLIATSYYFINIWFDNVLQKLINESVFVQSLIVFLSISSLINIFHPFTLRREISMKEVDIFLKKRQKIKRKGMKD
ncbi:hypothetical protein [Mariniflexile sp. HMF6888]|uniref:hypothetical protein n=1 Tax=Mariniflexile sp. HMF6888 TaxID=3373086 RepID=UPI00379E6A6F